MIRSATLERPMSVGAAVDTRYTHFSNTETAAFLAGRNGLGVPSAGALSICGCPDIEVPHA